MRADDAGSRFQRARDSGEREPERAEHPGPVLVLIADDEEPIAETLALVVEDAGYAPITALHGQAAMELVRQHHPALVITDLMMPLVDGKSLITELRREAARAGRPPIPVILMTAADLEYANTCGADAILPKPFELQDVEQLLQRFLAPASSGED